ncbi:MAG: metallophosphoesterase [Candidatus Latescibacteria bacterium]|nr:metallophosphoesterase [Candidatus Latescibacterota bacterium]
MKRKPGIFIILLTYLLVIGCGGQDIVGRITGPDGKPIGNLQVLLYNASADKPVSAAAEGVTNDKGIFHIKTDNPGDAVLEVVGDKGEGRIYIVHDKLRNRIDITYPVKEKIVFLHDNDLHFDFNSLGAFQTRLEVVRNSNKDVFLFNAGDTFVRHQARWIVDGQPMEDKAWYGERALYMIDTMNLLGYDLMTPGNHELAYIQPYTLIALEKAQFPLIAANIEVSTDAIPPLEPYRILSTSTWRTVAVLGLTTVSLPADSTGIKLLDPFDTAKQYIYLADENDLFVALTHIGYNNDRELAARFPNIDIIIGGHSHTLLENAEIINTVLVAQAGGSEHIMSKDHVKYLGEVDVILENGEIKEKKGHVMVFPLP